MSTSPADKARAYAERETGHANQEYVEQAYLAGRTAARKEAEALVEAAIALRAHGFCGCGCENCVDCAEDCTRRIEFDMALAAWRGGK